MNAWTEFRKLLDTTYKWVGLVESVNINSGTVIVKIPNSTKSIEVMGPNNEYTVNDYVFIENDKIVGKAPDLRTISTELVY